MPEALIRGAFQQAARFHGLPIDRKMEVRVDKHNVGYLPMRGDTLRTSTVQTVTKANLNEAFFMARDLPDDHPDVIADRRFRSANRWPAALPGFREAVVGYCDALERLVHEAGAALRRRPRAAGGVLRRSVPRVPVQAAHDALPHQAAPADDEFGIAPHTDTSFLTLLAPNEVPGLSIRTQAGEWLDAPVVPGAFVVNGGQMLQRWTNDCFLATPHRAINRSGGERYALAFFCDSNIDWPIASVPTTVGPDRPPKYPTTWYTDYMIQYQKRTYDLLADANRQAAE